MIEYKIGSIFESEAQCLVNPINCAGVMGKGLALDFKRQFPGMFHFYKKHCESGDLRYGTVGFWIDSNRKAKIVCLFPTKIHWRDHSTVALIDASLQAFLTYASPLKITRVAFPKIGCGLGGLDFDYQIKPLLERYFVESSILAEVYI